MFKPTKILLERLLEGDTKDIIKADVSLEDLFEQWIKEFNQVSNMLVFNRLKFCHNRIDNTFGITLSMNNQELMTLIKPGQTMNDEDSVTLALEEGLMRIVLS